jgi:hypothetical protein
LARASKARKIDELRGRNVGVAEAGAHFLDAAAGGDERAGVRRGEAREGRAALAYDLKSLSGPRTPPAARSESFAPAPLGTGAQPRTTSAPIRARRARSHRPQTARNLSTHGRSVGRPPDADGALQAGGRRFETGWLHRRSLDEERRFSVSDLPRPASYLSRETRRKHTGPAVASSAGYADEARNVRLRFPLRSRRFRLTTCS